jgi:hypothetical protein
MNDIVQTISKAKALFIDNNTIYIARGYAIYRSDDNGKIWILDGKIKDKKNAFLSLFSRLVNRALRLEISSMLILNDGSRVVSAKKGIFVAVKGSSEYLKKFDIIRGNKPMNICQHRDGTLYFGEYFLNGKYIDNARKEVNIYKSSNNGQSWDICYTFPKDTIRHIHGIFYDKYSDSIWVTTGDRDNESIIANTMDNFKTLNIIKSGAQKYRAVTLLFYKNYIVYGTDTEHETNYIYCFERHNLKEECLQELQGSVLMATQVGDRAIMSTAVEPSLINNHTNTHIWFSLDGLHWEDIYSAKKDKYSFKYFQYGRITFPKNAILKNKIIFSGHALNKIDNKILICTLN